MKYKNNKCDNFDTYYNEKKENKKQEIICIKTNTSHLRSYL